VTAVLDSQGGESFRQVIHPLYQTRFVVFMRLAPSSSQHLVQVLLEDEAALFPPRFSSGSTALFNRVINGARRYAPPFST
jgi:hypothetical protein